MNRFLQWTGWGTWRGFLVGLWTEERGEGLFGVGGSGATTTRNNELGAWNSLNNIGAQATPAGFSQIGQGTQNLSTSANFWNTLLSGNRGQIAQTLSPEISTLQNQKQQSLDTTQQFGDRSGGTNATLQATQNSATSAIDNLVNTLIPQAATNLGTVGAAQEAGGQSTLGIGENAFSTVGNQTTSLYPTQLGLKENIQGDIIQSLLDANVFNGESASGIIFGS